MTSTATVPTVVAVGAASRDLTEDDPRGWRLGGGVCYSALTTARLGLPTAALIGVDADAADAEEFDVLRAAGVDVVLASLAHGPVFRNVEHLDGRRQEAADHAEPISPVVFPERWRTAPGWILAPVAGELSAEWADAPREDATVALGWQGLLRDVVAGSPVRRRPPRDDSLLRRADVVGVSRDDLDGSVTLAKLCRLLRPGATLVVTQGDRGGLVLEAGHEGPTRVRHYPALRSSHAVDATGAGDTFLATFAASRIEPRLVGGRLARGAGLRLAAAAASLVVERPGLAGVPERGQLRERLAAGSAAAGQALGYGDGDAASTAAPGSSG